MPGIIGKLTFSLSLLITVCFSSSCVKEEKPPENILSKKELTEVLIKAHLLEAKVESFKPKADSSQQLFDRLELLMFERDSVDKERYDLTLKWYLDHPEELFSIYSVVVDSLSLRAKNRDID